MSTRRVPLSSNPNAANSPYKATSKLKRSYATIQREESYGQPPPAKKQMVDAHHTLKTPTRQQSHQSSAEGKVFTRKPSSSHPSAFERKLVDARGRERPAQQKVTKTEKLSEENLEATRVWQKHTRRQFPRIVFFFESGSEEARHKCTKQVISLGASEEKFFSNAVTHVITTRPIPPELGSTPAEAATSSTSDLQTSQPQTINPSVLDRPSESANPSGAKGKFLFDVPINTRAPPQGHENDAKRQMGRNADVLHRARELGMKIWALEKLERMMTTMFTDTGSGLAHGHNTRGNAVQGSVAAPRVKREADLSQLLRNERINGPVDPTVTMKDIVRFKGPYIYICDIDEKTKPIMVREYAKVSHKEDGDWPQFRSVAQGKCPFVEELNHSRREAEREDLLRVQKQQEKERMMIPRTRAATEAARMQPPRIVSNKQALAETDHGSNRSVSASTRHGNPFNSKDPGHTHTDMEVSSRATKNAFASRAGQSRLFGGEPVASGIQPSALTSAIQSTVSSTAAQPGNKVGTSKGVHGLQRKVLEKNSGGPASHGGLASSHRMTDIAAVAARDESNRPNSRRGQEKLALIEEDVDPSEAEQTAVRAETTRQAKAVQQRKLEKRDSKPGYCENCQDKFDDFEEHIVSRKHRKFADKAENWSDLDALLDQLARPEK